jgi:hypothetical protein
MAKSELTYEPELTGPLIVDLHIETNNVVEHMR